MNFKTVVQILGYLGLVPFFVAIWYVYINQAFLGLSPSWLFIVYSGIILTFLAGAFWGILIQSSDTKDIGEEFNAPSKFQIPKGMAPVFAIITNLIALTAWVVVVISDNYDVFALFTLLIGFVIVLWMELGWNLQFKAKQKSGYLSMRWKLTVVVVSCHIAMLLIVR